MRSIQCLLFLLIFSISCAHAADWKVMDVSGDVKIGEHRAGVLGETVRPGEAVETGDNAHVLLESMGQKIRLGANARIVIETAGRSGRRLISQETGAATYNVNRKKVPHFEVRSKYVAAVVKGTTFVIDASSEDHSVNVVEGLVDVELISSGQHVDVAAGQSAIANKNSSELTIVSNMNGLDDGSGKHAASETSSSEAGEPIGEIGDVATRDTVIEATKASFSRSQAEADAGENSRVIEADQPDGSTGVVSAPSVPRTPSSASTQDLPATQGAHSQSSAGFVEEVIAPPQSEAFGPNIVEGPDNLVLGFENTITGETNTVDGNRNLLVGDENSVTGDGNFVGSDENESDKNTIAGSANTVAGKGNLVTGDGNILGSESVNADRNEITGITNAIYGDDSFVLGNNNSIGNSENAFNQNYIEGDHNTIMGQKNIVRGVWNNIVGRDNAIEGDWNSILGDSNSIIGSFNQVTGDHNAITGDSNNVEGDHNVLRGDGNLVAGNKNEVEGNTNQVIGVENVLFGSGTGVFGNENQITGDNLTVIGDDRVIE